MTSCRAPACPSCSARPAEYESYIAALVKAGVMEDSSYVWWAIRPSLKHPTLELRAPDSCTLVEDSIAIAALYRTLARRLTRNPWQNWDLTAVTRAIVVENKWRAQRYGVHGTFVDISGNGAISVAEMLEQVLEDVRARRAGARLPQGSRALPHHRRQRHLGRHAARGVRAGAGRAAKTATTRCARSPTGSPKRRCNSGICLERAPALTRPAFATSASARRICSSARRARRQP